MWIKSLPWAFCSRWKNYSLSYFLSQIPSSTAPNTAPKRFLSSGEARLMKESVRMEPWQSLWGGRESWCCEGLVKGALTASGEELLSWILGDINSMQGRNVAMHESKAPLSLLFPLPSFFLLPYPSTPLFLTLPELITTPGHPETNSQVRNHLASLTAHPIPTNSCLMGGHSCVSPGPPRDFLPIPLPETLVVSIFGKGSWQSPWEEKRCGGLVERMWRLEPGRPWALLQLYHLIPG